MEIFLFSNLLILIDLTHLQNQKNIIDHLPI